MTRINVVPVQLLKNDHLLAEYKEITRPFNKVLKRIENNTMHKVSYPDQYVLGSGHETFFFNKLLFLFNRYQQLYSELISRGFNLDTDKYNTICKDLNGKLSTTIYWNDYIPNHQALYLNMARLAKRSNLPSVLNELENK